MLDRRAIRKNDTKTSSVIDPILPKTGGRLAGWCLFFAAKDANKFCAQFL
jgi:hypothetical protein